MTISIKLNPDELRTLVVVFERAIQTEACNTRQEAIVNIIMLRFYEKLKAKSIFIKKPVRISVDAEAALAFIEFFDALPLNRTSFAGNLINNISRQFHQQTIQLYNYY